MTPVIRTRKLSSGEDTTCTLVFPSAARIEENKLSVLSAIGTATIGYPVGDILEWQVPAGLKRLNVEAIFRQPEALENDEF